MSGTKDLGTIVGQMEQSYARLRGEELSFEARLEEVERSLKAYREFRTHFEEGSFHVSTVGIDSADKVQYSDYDWTVLEKK